MDMPTMEMGAFGIGLAVAWQAISLAKTAISQKMMSRTPGNGKPSPVDRLDSLMYDTHQTLSKVAINQELLTRNMERLERSCELIRDSIVENNGLIREHATIAAQWINSHNSR